MKLRVVYVGGPLCGSQEKLPEEELVDYLTCDCAGRIYTYKHCLRTVCNGAVKIQHRYIFAGHRPKLPSWLRRQIRKLEREKN